MGLTKQEQIELEKEFEEIIKESKRPINSEGRAEIRKAFDLGNKAHSQMRRKSGEPYFTHPIAVAKIVAKEIGLGPKSISSALLHDVVEDTDYTIADIERLFDPTVARIVDGLTKISHVLDKDASLQAENFRRMLMTMSQDIRVIFIKLADRVHNMRTLDSMPEYKQVKIASETIYLYAPLAHRLGLYSIKTELEDLALKYEHPLIYREISRKFQETEEERIKYIDEIITPLSKVLEEAGIKCSIKGRLKSIYSIWNKMQKKGVPFEEIYDFFAIRIVFETPKDYPDKLARAMCYQIMSIITEIYPHHEQRIRDWVKNPKSNGYESLHITVMGPRGQWVEIQIRSEKMDDIAEKGMASHWKYKTNEKGIVGGLDILINNLKDILQNNSNDSLSFLDDVKVNLFASEIYIFTPLGEIKTLPQDSSALDFAYDIHTEIGSKAIAAKVNHKLQPLSYILQSGDQVEIITSEKQFPKREWLSFLQTAKAKTKVKSSLKEERLYDIEKGLATLSKKLNELNIESNTAVLKELQNKYNADTKDELYQNIGNGQIKIDDIAKILSKKDGIFARYWKLSFSRPKDINKKETFVIDDIKSTNYSLATCCNPIPGDEVAGYLNKNNSVIIHKKTCPNLVGLAAKQGDKIISVKWSSYKQLSFIAKVKIEGFDQTGLILNISQTIYRESNVNMKSIKFDSNNGIFTGEIEVYIHNAEDLHELIEDLIKVSGVNKVYRIEDNEEE